MSTINLGDLLLSISQTIDLADKEIAFHQQRTAYIAMRLCKSMHLDEELTKEIFMASLLHDIGAISITEKAILHKDEEQNPYKHCLKGELLLNRCSYFRFTAELVRHHHRRKEDWENFNLSEPRIMGAQIIHLSDFIEYGGPFSGSIGLCCFRG